MVFKKSVGVRLVGVEEGGLDAVEVVVVEEEGCEGLYDMMSMVSDWLNGSSVSNAASSATRADWMNAAALGVSIMMQQYKAVRRERLLGGSSAV